MKKLIKNIFLKLIFNTLKHLHELHNDLTFSSEKQKVDKVKKLAANFPDKKEYSIHIRNLKQTLSLGLVLKKKFTMSLNLTKKHD